MNITVEELIEKIDEYTLIDVRSEDEYKKGTIKHAINIPVLDNEKRKLIGTIYSKDKEEAYERGLSEVSKILPDIIQKIKEEKNKNKKIVIFCYKGGTRSSSIQNVLKLIKEDVIKLEGGYKKYRKFIIEDLDRLIKEKTFKVINGNTGCGKTEIIKKLNNKIDLEDLANHRGSMFGKMNINIEQNQIKFEEDLYYELKNIKEKEVYIECESRKIGMISLPNSLYDKMQESEHILIERTINKRIEIIKNTYQNINNEEVKNIILNNKHLKEKVSKKWIENLLYNLENDLDEFIKTILLDYYDKTYNVGKYNYTKTIIEDDDQKVIEELQN